ncbi:hypothetical protein O8C83_05800 [Aliarcobacter butzleri]|uniref:hypothetical protein n=1 Tax=Aliarcobacter butzleri TaxID=28197 RepID=UPI00263F586F|nr:hypothetical protein [Aliarcobacter butzleri]MDN5100330.1 hypothetical protein [Aliarcobacter butzleri]
MTRIKINEKEIDSLDSKLNKLYENDITLNYIKQYEEDRKKLLAPHSVDTISSELENLKESLSNINIKNAFPSTEAYIKYSEPILNTIKTNDYNNFQKLISEPFRPNLKNDYEQVLKATEIFLDSSKKVMNLGLAEQSYYDKLNESIEKYQTNKLEGSQGLLGLASEMNSDLFKTKLDLGLAYRGLADSANLGKTLEGLGSIAKFDLAKDSLSKIGELGKTDLGLAYRGLADSANLGKTLEGLGSIAKFDLAKDSLSKIGELGKTDLGLAYGGFKDIKELGISLKESINKMNLPNENSLTPNIKDFTIIPNINISDLKPLKMKDSIVYKQNEKLILKSEEQIEVMQKMSEYIIISNENQEIQAKKSNEQSQEIIINSNKQIEVMEKALEYTINSISNQEENALKLSNQNNELLKSSEKQIELMTTVADFISSQSKILNIQKENQELQNEHLRKQNEIMEDQIKANKSSSKIALWTAISSVLIGTIISLGIYILEDISDTKNHEELKKVIESDNNNFQFTKLIEQITLQNENLKLMNEQLIIQNKNLILIKNGITKEKKK